MFKNPCKRCLVAPCCSATCAAIIKRTNRMSKLTEGSKICIQFVITFLVIYSLTHLFLTVIAGGP